VGPDDMEVRDLSRGQLGFGIHWACGHSQLPGC
jgi:hypothetical protein